MVKDDTTTETMQNQNEQPVAKKAKIQPDNELNIDTEIFEMIEKTENQINKLEDEQSIAICKLEQEYVLKKQPIYEKRQEIIEKVDGFWKTAFLNHPQLSLLVAEDDLDCFEYLTAIKLDQVLRDEEVEADGQKYMKSLNYSVSFIFAENPFFENTCLTKSFYQVMDEVISESDEIKWKEGNNLIEKCKLKMENEKKNGKTDPSGDNEDEEIPDDNVDSFFDWFEDHEDAANDETGDMIREDLYIHALTYYTTSPESDDNDEEVDLEGESEE